MSSDAFEDEKKLWQGGVLLTSGILEEIEIQFIDWLHSIISPIEEQRVLLF